MFRLRLRSNGKPDTKSQSFWPIHSATTLLCSANRKTCITGIFQASHTNQRYFSDLYQPALTSFAQLVQQLPASEVDHHAAPGGMLDHTLESTLNALRLRRAHLLPANAAPEDVSRNESLWTYAVFASALLHDIGKIAVDQHITLYDRRKRSLADPWSPFMGPMTKPARWYTVDFRRDREYALHQRTSALLASRILPTRGMAWLSTNTEAFAAFSASVAGHYDAAGVLGQIVSEAERMSVARNKGATADSRYMAARTRPLHEKLLSALRVLIDRGELTLNRPGAAGWLTDEGLWMMGTRTVSAIRQQLTEEGHSGVPSSNSRLFDVLMQHSIVSANDKDQAIWRVRVIDGDWKPDPFTVLRFQPDKIWPLLERCPNHFTGSVEIVSSSVSVEEVEQTEEKQADDTDHEQKTTQPLESPPSSSGSQSNLVHGPWLKHTDSGTGQPDYTDHAASSEQPMAVSSDSPPLNNKHDARNCGQHFYDWLIEGLREDRIRYNQADTVVHVVEEGVFLVSPAIFRWFTEQHPEYESYSNVQKQAKRLNYNKIAPDGTNIHTYKVTGENRQSNRLKGFLISDKTMLFGDKIPSPNPHLTAVNKND